MDIELFVSGCRLCKETENMVRKVMGPRCTLKIYDLSKGVGREEAERLYNESLKIARKLGNQEGIAMIEANLRRAAKE